MNYLKRNLKNSNALPADVMRLVYEFADPLHAVRKQIENADYDLDEIMYQRMKKYIKNLPFITIYHTLLNVNGEYTSLNENNIDDRNLKDAILNYRGGYKDIVLKRNCIKINEQMICGLNHFQKRMDLEDCLNYVDKNITQNIHNYTHYPLDEIYPADGDVSKYYIRELFAVWRTIE